MHLYDESDLTAYFGFFTFIILMYTNYIQIIRANDVYIETTGIIYLE